MDRRTFLRSAGAAASQLCANLPVHNFDKYDFGAGPVITDLDDPIGGVPTA